MRGLHRHSLICAVLLAATVAAARPAPAHGAPALPSDRLHFGIASHSTDMAWFRASGVPWRYRYLYLAGGVYNQPWTTWQDMSLPPGQYAVDFMKDSASVGAIPVFTWYELLQSGGSGGESDRDWANLQNPGLMSSYYDSFRVLMDRAGAYGGTVVVHVEPDLWGYLQQRAGSDGAVAGVSRAFTAQLRSLRDARAPNVVLASHASMWSSGLDLATNIEPALNPEAEADKTAGFLASVGPWDAVFNDVDDHDAGWWEQQGNPYHWWDRTNQRFPNFSRYLRWVARLHSRTGLPQLAWQVPPGNQYFTTMDNTCRHYQDNVAEYFVGHPQDLFNAGLIAVMFGAGNGCQTTVGYTSDQQVYAGRPAADAGGSCPAACNTHVPQFPDDDGGYLRTFVGVYYAPPLPGPGPFNPVPPFRLVDTRQTGATLGPGGTLNVRVAGRDGLPASGVHAAAINVTVTSSSTSSYLTIYPTGYLVPNASTVNFTYGQTIANLSQVAIGQDGQVTVYNSQGSADVILDLVGWYSGDRASHAGLYRPLAPVRVLDTRLGTGGLSGPFGPNQSRDLDLRPDLPDPRASAVVLNLTAVNGTQASYLTAYPAGGGARPTASNLNFPPGRNLPNRVIVKLGAAGAAGRISVYNSEGTVDVVADLAGWFTDGTDGAAGGGLYQPMLPARILDTRPQYQVGPVGSPLASNSSLRAAVAGLGGVGPAAGAAVVNVAVTNPTSGSFLTVYPGGQVLPLASDLNFGPGETITNLDLVRLGGGAVEVYNNLGSTDVFIDAEGWYG